MSDMLGGNVVLSYSFRSMKKEVLYGELLGNVSAEG